MFIHLHRVACQFASALIDDEAGTMVEYALILSLIAVLSITLIGSIGTKTSTAFSSVNTNW